MQAYEKLGVFYLGRYHDLATRKTLSEPLLYNSQDLLTHALCVGMTGSGKTGLCFDIIEEAAIDGIPAILIDPKGDLGNLLLAFPGLLPSDFEPWIDPAEARAKNLSPAQFAGQQADLWRNGLAEWSQDGERIQRLRDSAEFMIYTPGSNAGVPISILRSFAAPPEAILSDDELLRERINTTVGSLLGLAGVEADPTRSREALFLANILQRAWQEGRDLDLAALIQEIQTPAIQRIGVMDLESFYPAKDRFALASAVNALLASPGFSAWLEGEPLDIQRVCYTPAGKPRVAIFSIAHLNETERMFFVTLLLNEILGWMRTQSGAASLRALLYMDEIFGYFPPVANPPSKLPLLTLLKQGRAFGLGCVLATQNPVDLDYKGLANIGTWFVGRLQTERDKQRLLDGLEGAAAAQGSGFDRAAMDQTLAALRSRVFLLHNVHQEGAALFESRWSMSYLRGPMTRSEIKAVTDARGRSAAVASGSNATTEVRVHPVPAPAPATSFKSSNKPSPSLSAAAGFERARPTLPPAIAQYFIPARGAAGAGLAYKPMILGAASVRFADAKANVDLAQPVLLITPATDDAVPVDWAEAQESQFDPNDLERQPVPGAEFAPLPTAAAQPQNYAAWQREFVNSVYGSRKITVLRSATCNELSKPDEAEGDFRVRLSQASRERRDARMEQLRAKFGPKTAALQERLRRAEQAVEREAGQARSATLATALSFGSTLLGAFLGRKVMSATNINKAASALKGVGRSVEQAQDVARAGETVEAVRQQLAALDAQFQAEAAAIAAETDPARERLDKLELRPSKANISVRLLALVWAPHRRNASGELEPAF